VDAGNGTEVGPDGGGAIWVGWPWRICGPTDRRPPPYRVDIKNGKHSLKDPKAQNFNCETSPVISRVKISFDVVSHQVLRNSGRFPSLSRQLPGGESAEKDGLDFPAPDPYDLRAAFRIIWSNLTQTHLRIDDGNHE